MKCARRVLTARTPWYGQREQAILKSISVSASWRALYVSRAFSRPEIYLGRMLDIERTLDALLTECAQRAPFTPKDLYPKFVADDVDEQEKYEQESGLTRSLTFLERARLISGDVKVEFTQALRLRKEVKYGTLTKFGRLVTRAPRFLRLGLFFALLQWKRVAAILGAFASVKLLQNAYQGIVLAIGWVEYFAFLALIWVIYLLIRRALN